MTLVPLVFLIGWSGASGTGGSAASPGWETDLWMAGYGVMADEAGMDYTVHEAWNDATNVYLIAILASFGLLMYARKNKRKIMRIFTVPPADPTPEPNFYDNLQKVRLRQQLDLYYIARKYDQQQGPSDSVQLTVE